VRPIAIYIILAQTVIVHLGTGNYMPAKSGKQVMQAHGNLKSGGPPVAVAKEFTTPEAKRKKFSQVLKKKKHPFEKLLDEASKKK
jgi:hypothetical protein